MLNFENSHENDFENSLNRDRVFSIDYYKNENLYKELRIIRNNSNAFISKCKGYYIKENENKIYLLYDYFDFSLEKFIKNKTLDFNNKLKFLKNFLDLVKTHHCSGIISLRLSIKTLFFTHKFILKLTSFWNSINMNSDYELDRSCILGESNVNIFTSPEIYLKNYDQISWSSDIWSLGVILSMLFSDKVFDFRPMEYYRSDRVPEIFFNDIQNVYVKAIITGILRIKQSERPNIFEIIDVYNSLVDRLNLDESFKLIYSKNEMKNFEKYSTKSTVMILDIDTNERKSFFTNKQTLKSGSFDLVKDSYKNEESKYLTGLNYPNNFAVVA